MKNLQKIKCYVFLIAVFFVFAFKANASLEISQIMYDPEGADGGREWIKLYNDSDEELTITGGQSKNAWRISGGESKESLHYINEDLNIGPLEYAVIAKDKDIFKQEYPSFSGPVTSASISFNNTAGIVKIWDGLDPRNVMASLSYSKEEVVSTNKEEDTSENSEVSIVRVGSSSSSIYSKKPEPKITKIDASITSDDVAISGLALKIKPKVYNNKGTTYNVGRFVWNFGDGSYLESNNAEPFDHIYWYEGEYLISLEFYKSSGSFESEVSVRKVIKVISSSLYISSVGNYSDPYLEFENKSKYELDLSNWEVKGVSKTFIIPKSTILLSGKKMKLSPKITNFSVEDLKYITIINPNKEIMATYPNRVFYNNTPASSSVYKSSSKTDPKTGSIDESKVVNLNNLNSLASSANSNINDTSYYILGLIFIIGIGIIIVILLRGKNKHESDDEMNVNNFKIME